MATLPPDLREFCERLVANKVDFLVVGAHAVAHHGLPRYTGDLDILVRRTPDNADLLHRTIVEFGFGSLDIAPGDFLSDDVIIQLGRAPSRIDILTELSGVSEEEAWAGRQSAEVDGVAVYVLGKAELIKNKLATGRPKDLADVEGLDPVEEG